MGDIISRADLKTAERIDDSDNDAELDLIIKRVEYRFQGEIGQNLTETTYTDEKYTGDGTPFLKLRHYPLTAVSALAIEDESAIDESSDDVVRYEVTADAIEAGLVTLVSRVWSKPTGGKVQNVTVTYDAGYSPSTIEDAIRDAWALILDASSQLFRDMERRRKGLASQSHMSGAVAYFNEGNRETTWFENSWSPVVYKYRRRGRSAVLS